MTNSDNLNDLSKKELERFGFVRIEDEDDFEELYYVKHGGSSTKIYFERTDFGFNLRGFRLIKEKEIRTLDELMKSLEEIKTIR